MENLDSIVELLESKDQESIILGVNLLKTSEYSNIKINDQFLDFLKTSFDYFLYYRGYGLNTLEDYCIHCLENNDTIFTFEHVFFDKARVLKQICTILKTFNYGKLYNSCKS